MKIKSFLDQSNQTPKITATHEGDSILVRVEATRVEPPDELVAFPFGLERAAASRAIENGDLVAARIGRRVYSRRSNVLGLIDKLAVDPSRRPSGDTETDYLALVAKSRGQR